LRPSKKRLWSKKSLNTMFSKCSFKNIFLYDTICSSTKTPTTYYDRTNVCSVLSWTYRCWWAF
jgi:hypothetical protein